jgi:anti-sigma B factor antagonist
LWRRRIETVSEVPFALRVDFPAARSSPPPTATGWGEGSDGPLAVVFVAGEIDLSTMPELRRTLTKVIAPPREEVVVDLAAVEFIDASGVGVLVGAAGEAARAGVKFRLQALSPQVERVLHLAQLDGNLEVQS